MTRLVLAPKSTEGIEEKLLKLRSQKSGKNASENHENVKYHSSRYEMIQSKKTAILMQIKSLQGVKNTQSSFRSLEDRRELSLLFSLL
jgi:hypothetical protein